MEIKKKKVEDCGICHKKIYLESDNYCRLIDYKKGKLFLENYYHVLCWNEKLTNLSSMKQTTMKLLQRVSKILPKEEKIYEFK